MDVSMHARTGKLPDSLRNQAMQRFSRMERVDMRITAGTLVVESAAGLHRADARLQIAGGAPLIGQNESATLRAAIDGALDRLERQLKRRRKRMITKRTRGGIAAPRDVVMP